MILRLIFAGIFFLLSLMVVLPATEIVLWYTVLLVTELGHWFSLATLGVLLWECIGQRRPVNFLTIGLCIIAIGLFLTPLVQATFIASRLPEQLALAFGEKGRPSSPIRPLNFAKLWGLTPASTAQEETLNFPGGDGNPLKMLSYRDATPGPRPCILIVHGGGWNTGTPDQLSAWSRQLAAMSYRVASISYRLAPKATWPAPREDVAAALAYLKTHADELGIDPQKFILLGRSAGGQIALAATNTLNDPAIRGCIASYAPTDMNFAYWTGKENDMLGSRPLVRAVMGGPPAGLTALYHDASPLDFVGPGTPPALLIHGSRDEIVWVRHSERLRDGMQQAGRPVFLLELPWATHGFDFIWRGPGAQLELYAMSWFLRACTGS